ncbi:MAG: ankyrin repeat domain-containing protein, partial [Synechococcales cyanobacterium T60_A2020_003]|nr:ankyrin repeat domain-containing protein [Synechococcales cyanobacterium T60_A2020_003]
MMSGKDTLLVRAVHNGSLEQVQALLDTGADANTVSPDGTSVLMQAAQVGYTEIVRVLLAHHANVNYVRSHYGLTALMVAAAANQGDVLRLLIAAGADVNQSNEDGSTALMIAAFKGYQAIVQQLLAAGAEVNIRDQDGDTALKVAIAHSQSTIVAQLLEAGADLSQVTSSEPLIIFANELPRRKRTGYQNQKRAS